MSSSTLTAYKCSRIVLEDEIVDGAVIVDSSGKIAEIVKTRRLCSDLGDRVRVIQITNGVLMPGIVDSHVHVNSPGRSEWEDYPCATQAAAAGGVTTIADMPLNSIPPTTTLKNLITKTEEAEGTVYVDVAFWGGVIPGNQDDLLSLIKAGVVGFKCFLCPSGVDEFPHVIEDDLDKALKVLQNTKTVLAFHAECNLDEDDCKKSSSEEYKTYLLSRPPEMEHKALKLINKMAEKYPNVRYHIVHVSAASAASIIRDMKNNGVHITAETCPHYLTLSSEEIPNCATEYKCAPPVRCSKNKENMWKFVEENVIDLIVSDHSPCTPELKEGGFMEAWGGISSLQFGLSLIWTNASQRGLNLMDISRLLSAAPAKLCRLDEKKGSFRVGLDADMIVFDPEDGYTVTKDIIYHKNKLTPYLGMKLKGKVLQTFLRGQLIYDNNKFSDIPQGQLLLNN
ncbi:allantoinase [Arctopsyche grandis]|uniref:allantoinase n=1 Tax=Arctopsyche grandis TaxID=121162 RepID=UPI00406D9E2A